MARMQHLMHIYLFGVSINRMLILQLIFYRFGKSTHISMICNSVTHLRSYTNSAIADIAENSSLISPEIPHERRYCPADIAAPSADIAVPSADITVPSADITVPSADVSLLSANVSASSADVSAPRADVSALSADVSALSADIVTLNGDCFVSICDVSQCFKSASLCFMTFHDVSQCFTSDS